jgi:hypothetical protein
MSKCSILVKEKYKTLAEENREILDEMISDIEQINQNSRTPNGFRKSLDKYIKDTGDEKIINNYYQLVQLQKRSNNMKRISSAVNKVEGLLSLLRASNYNFADSSLTVESVMNTRAIKYQTILDQAFTEAEFKILASKQLDREIIKHIVSDGKLGDPQAAKAAETFKKILNMLHKDKVDVGIQENFIKDYAFNQRDLFNVEEMGLMGKDAWVDFAYSNLDHARTFPNIEGIEARKKYLGDVFDGTLQRAEDVEAVDFSQLPPDRIKKSIPKKYTKPRTLFYTADGLANMFERFSKKSLIESMLAESAKTARDVAMFEVIGPGAQTEFATLVQKSIRELQKEIKDLKPNDPKAIKVKEEIQAIKEAGSDFNSYFKQITNSSNVTGKSWLADILTNIRSLVSMMSLGGASFSAVTDLATGVTALQVYTGENYFKLAGESTQSLIKSLPVESQKRTASQLSIALESALGNILRVEGSTGPITKGINKLNHLYSKINPLQQQARFHRVAFTSLLSMKLGQWAGGSWKDIDPFASNALLKAGIKETDWEAFGAMRKPIKDGEFSIDTISTDKISDELALKIIAEHKKTNPAFEPKTASQYRAYLEKRIDSYFNEFSNMAAPNPGLREKKVLLMGTQKGTEEGELIRTMAMLKSFTVKQANIMQRVYLSNPNRKANIAHLSGMFLGLSTMGYVAESLRSISKNETPPDPTSTETIRNSILRSGAGSIVFDAMFGQSYGGNTDFFTALIGGPVVSKADTLVGVARKTVKGEAELKDATEIGSLLPGSNLWYLKSALHYTIMDDFKEELRPGHKRRMEQRRKENEGLLWRQESIIE